MAVSSGGKEEQSNAPLCAAKYRGVGTLWPLENQYMKPAMSASRHIRQHIRSLRNDADFRARPVLRQAVRDGLLDGRRRLDVTATQRVRGQPMRHHLDAAALDDLRHFFELPLVHDEVI